MKKSISLIKYFLFLSVSILCLNCASIRSTPSSFVKIKEHIPNIVLDIRYHGNNNFIGSQISGYHAPQAYLTKEAAIALKKVQKELNQNGFGLKVFDAYRPQRAVNHFIRWAKVLNDTLMKSNYYPNIAKKDLFKLGYIAEKSGHSRGSTLDLSIVEMNTEEEIDMATPFDFFGRKSHHDYENITPTQKANRHLLRTTMEKYGFEAYPEEWWHYTLVNEPFPDTYFDFVVK